MSDFSTTFQLICLESFFTLTKYLRFRDDVSLCLAVRDQNIPATFLVSQPGLFVCYSLCFSLYTFAKCPYYIVTLNNWSDLKFNVYLLLQYWSFALIKGRSKTIFFMYIIGLTVHANLILLFISGTTKPDMCAPGTYYYLRPQTVISS